MRSSRPVVACILLSSFVAPASAQKVAPKPSVGAPAATIEARQIQPTPEAIARRLAGIRATAVTRQGGETAAAQSARLRTQRATIAQTRSRPLHLPATIGGPAITKVNNKTSGVLEPGGAYQIVGRGFGNFEGPTTQSQYSTSGYGVWLDNPNPTEPGQARHFPFGLAVLSWTDQAIYLEIPESVTGLADVDRMILRVKSPEVTVESRAFGFRAKRAEAALSNIPREAFQPDHITSATFRVEGGKPEATRWSESGNRDTPCFSPGTDRYRLDQIPLKPGWWINRVDFHFEAPVNDVSNYPLYEWRVTGFGKYAARFEGNELVVDWAVRRARRADRTGGGKSTCESGYSLTFHAVGPVGTPAQ